MKEDAHSNGYVASPAFNTSTYPLKVPFVMCGLETTNARKVVLLRMQSKENWWYSSWKERKEEINFRGRDIHYV